MLNDNLYATKVVVLNKWSEILYGF